MKLAFVFPGQGSQSLGMMQGFDALPVVRKTFEEAGDILKLDLWQMVTAGPVEAINQTINTQPVMLTAGVAVYRAWQEMGGSQPEFMAGHSLGEYTALVAAGALPFADALPLVRYRAQVMQEAVAEGVGGMAAILGLDDDAVRAVCAEAAQGEVLEAVNFNSPGQVVIAGSKAAVERGMELAKARGAKRALPLPVSVPSHCSLMKPAAEKLGVYLQSVAMQAPKVPVLHNADVKSYSGDAEIKDALVRQLYMPVRWVETVQALAAAGVTHVAECGPGKVLAGLNKRIVSELQGLALTDAAALEQAKSI
ncbi:MAG: ACP S-malonyltransferase [Sulfurimicrobium sp.]|nr:ACP S-malonyltransferase [Sulfurimicrobium sp.]MDO9189863.1 ACP S-malonyltransferase [Sulfurimicrobium sp.]MDP1704379.1 ACP S-malonyltransferase [Sulfurimicrobium sp.]MDP2199749.1 ACP S-malonyltransferase [Sulfurimicrobium sp.]MDP2962708.1 ACP S-malonyltransferase [Sulfurimicrobium sp.]